MTDRVGHQQLRLSEIRRAQVTPGELEVLTMAEAPARVQDGVQLSMEIAHATTASARSTGRNFCTFATENQRPIGMSLPGGVERLGQGPFLPHRVACLERFTA